MRSATRVSRTFTAGVLAPGLAMLLSACSPDALLPEPRSGPPNIIMILADDQAYRDYGFMGSELAETPNIDDLARGGSVFPVTYNTSSICRPSQIALLTGLDPLQFENTLARMGPELRGLDRIRRFMTLPRALAQDGYARLQAGKLWEGTYELAGFSAGRKKTVSVGVHKLAAWTGGPASHAVGRTTMKPVYDFIDRNLDRRFYIWFAPLLPHAPFDAPEKYAKRYEGRGLPKAARGYFANVAWLDDVVGRLVAHLEARRIRQDTLIVFLADNGLEIDLEQSTGWAGFGGIRGKASMYELGWRTPMIFNWPGRIPAGERFETLASTLDVFQTLLDYAGFSALPGRPGKSLRPVLEGGDPNLREALIGSDGGTRPRQAGSKADGGKRRPPAFFVRTERWHYIWNSETGVEELYQIVEDPGEERNVVAAHPDLASGFRGRIEAWRRQMSVPVEALAWP